MSTIGGKERPGLVHRLDKDTSGVMVIAKTDEAHRALSAQFKQHTITRVYEALISGVPKKGHGLIELAIGRDKKVVRGRLHFVLAASIGSTVIVSDVTTRELVHAMRAIGMESPTPMNPPEAAFNYGYTELEFRGGPGTALLTRLIAGEGQDGGGEPHFL
mgnify:CR=1 FL=1